MQGQGQRLGWAGLGWWADTTRTTEASPAQPSPAQACPDLRDTVSSALQLTPPRPPPGLTQWRLEGGGRENWRQTRTGRNFSSGLHLDDISRPHYQD